MSRIRSIHPGQWTDDKFVACSSFARLLAIALRNFSDDHGVFEWNPLKMKMLCFPGDNCDVAQLLEELEHTGQVSCYEIDGRRYGLIRNFMRFQRPQKPKYLYPVPADLDAAIDENTIAEPVVEDRYDTSPIPVEDRYDTSTGKPPQREDVGGRSSSLGSDEPKAVPAPFPVSDIMLATDLPDPRKAFYELTKSVLGKNAGGQGTRLIRHFNGDINEAMDFMRLAGRKADPPEYVGRVLAGDAPVETDWDLFYRRMGLSPSEYEGPVH